MTETTRGVDKYGNVPLPEGERNAVCRWCREGRLIPAILDNDGTRSDVTNEPGVWSHAYEDSWWPCLGVHIKPETVKPKLVQDFHAEAEARVNAEPETNAQVSGVPSLDMRLPWRVELDERYRRGEMYTIFDCDNEEVLSSVGQGWLEHICAAVNAYAGLVAALRNAHACATLRDDGTCDGCFVGDVLRGA